MSDNIEMAGGTVVWFYVLLLGSAWANPVPEPQCPCEDQYIPQSPYPCPISPHYSTPNTEQWQLDPTNLYPEPNPDPYQEQFNLGSPEEAVVIGPCDPGIPQVNYQHGQGPLGSIIVKPGAIRFPPPPPITVQPGEIRLPPPPAIWVKPPPVHPPTPAPILVKPPPIQLPSPAPILVRPPSIKPPNLPPFLVKVPPVMPPRCPPIKCQPPPVPVPKPGYLVIHPPAIRMPVPPTITFHPNPASHLSTIGSARILLFRPGHSNPIPLHNDKQNPSQYVPGENYGLNTFDSDFENEYETNVINPCNAENPYGISPCESAYDPENSAYNNFVLNPWNSDGYPCENFGPNPCNLGNFNDLNPCFNPCEYGQQNQCNSGPFEYPCNSYQNPCDQSSPIGYEPCNSGLYNNPCEFCA